jgi:hypothetical protein
MPCTPGGFWTWLPGPELTKDFRRRSQSGLSFAASPPGAMNGWTAWVGTDQRAQMTADLYRDCRDLAGR